jgi:hypothetical protein
MLELVIQQGAKIRFHQIMQENQERWKTRKGPVIFTAFKAVRSALRHAAR